jgi:hypothetical protein
MIRKKPASDLIRDWGPVFGQDQTKKVMPERFDADATLTAGPERPICAISGAPEPSPMMLTRLIAPLILAALVSAAQAQAPGQIPGTLPPAPPVMAPPPPPVAPAQVPSVVTPLPSPSYGIPPGVTGPVYGGGTISPSIRYRQPPKKRKIKRRPRTSDILLIRAL